MVPNQNYSPRSKLFTASLLSMHKRLAGNDFDPRRVAIVFWREVYFLLNLVCWHYKYIRLQALVMMRVIPKMDLDVGEMVFFYFAINILLMYPEHRAY